MRARSIILTLLLAGSAVFATAGVASAAPVRATTAAQEEEAEITPESEECIELLEEGKEVADCHEAPSVILPATNELVWGAISFFLLLILMWKFALPPVKKMMEDRTERIRDNLDEAEKTKADAQRVLEDYQLQLADAKNESARIIEEARQTAEQMRRDLMVRAEAEVNELRDRTRNEIEAAQQRAIADLRSQVSELAIGAAEIVVQKNLDRDTNRALVERFIEQVGTTA
jgi:F-type H+-transporting ATPase subunit b